MATTTVTRLQKPLRLIDNRVGDKLGTDFTPSHLDFNHLSKGISSPISVNIAPDNGKKLKSLSSSFSSSEERPFDRVKSILKLNKGPRLDKVPDFSAQDHLCHDISPAVHSMEELGFDKATGISPMAVSEPFPLLTSEAVEAIRSEVLREEVFEKHHYSSNISAGQLRGYSSRHSPFLYNAFKDPRTLAIISRIAGVDLVPAMDYEIGHINISVKTKKEVQHEIDVYRGKPPKTNVDKNDVPIVGWHTDSYPFVCVVMLSDTAGMIGGETALRTGRGDIMKVRGPHKGNAVVLQGRYILHQALQSIGVSERTTLVTSFRPKDPTIPDESVLTTVRGISDLGELYEQYAEYRLKILEDRVHLALDNLRKDTRAKRKFQTTKFKKVLDNLIELLKSTDQEIVEDHLVSIGHVPETLPGNQ